MEVKQYTKVLVWDEISVLQYRGFLYMEVKQYKSISIGLK